MQRSTLGSFGPVLAALLLTACGGGGGGGSMPPPTPTPVNVVPMANAGSNQTVTAGAVVTLTGTASSDSDGTIASYAWTQTAGTPTVTLSSSTNAQPTFTAPAVTVAATFTFSLIVKDNSGASSAASTVNIIVNPALAAGNVTGQVRFTRIPTTAAGLNYAGPLLQAARGVTVQAVDPAAPTVALATASTDNLGNYSLTVAASTNVKIVVVAQMLRANTQALPHWNFLAEDLDANPTTPAPYTYTDGQTLSSSAGATHNIDIPSGFDSSGAVTGTRASAPFAVLDTVYKAIQLVLSVAPNTDFPPLILDWAADNPGSETFFDPNSGQHIVLSADPTEDTDEFDENVIAHEFGHYIEFNFSRADNIGGSHQLGDKLDIRVAFGEGFGYAFGAIVLNDPVARDTYTSPTQFANCTAAGSHFLCTSAFNVDTNPQTNPAGAPNNNYGCWCSESSVWSILWDIYDSGAEANDSVALGFQPMWNVLVNNQKTTHAFTSIFSFLDELKRANPGSATAIDTLAAAQNISSVQDVYGTGETHAPTQGSNGVASAAALAVYTDITVGGPAVIVRNVDDAGQYNTLGNHRFLKFTLSAVHTTTITVRTSNPDVNADPDFLVYRNGAFFDSGESAPPQPEVLTMTNAAAGDYLLDVYDCANGCSTAQGTAGDYDITVTVN